MASRSRSRLRGERLIALMLVIAILLYTLLPLAGLIASYLSTDPYALQQHGYGVFFPVLGSLFFSLYLLRTSRDELRRPLPLATVAGLLLGLFLGCISNLPYYLLLLLTFTLLYLLQAFPSPPQETLPILISFQYLPFTLLLLTFAQAIHAAVAGFIGASIARKRLLRREVNAERP